MIQMHGGVGYTWEFDCHLFYRRAKSTGGTRSAVRQRVEARSLVDHASTAGQA